MLSTVGETFIVYFLSVRGYELYYKLLNMVYYSFFKKGKWFFIELYRVSSCQFVFILN